MLDLKELRESPEKFKLDLARRNLKDQIKVIGRILDLDSKNRSLVGKAQELRQERNVFSKEIEILKKAKKPAGKVLEKAKNIPGKIKETEDKQKKISEEIESLLLRLPNLLHESVPVGASDKDNVVVRRFLEPKVPSFELKHHGELAVALDGADFEHAVKVSGSGFFFLKNELVLLDFALQQLAIKMLLDKKFSLIQVPFFLRKKSYEGVTDMADFESVMYKIEGEDLYLIATSEHPIAAMLSDEILSEEKLPLKFCGISSCFRKEVGKHGLDERGFFRVHQFTKVEQFVFSKPEDSWKIHEELVSNAEAFLKEIGIPFEVTNVCSGDIGTVAAKKYDINGWSPREKKFIELMSVSNCTGYQARRLGIKFRRKNGEKEFVHTLNGTMVATSRLLRLILENFQTKEGSVQIPRALQPFMYGKKEISPK